MIMKRKLMYIFLVIFSMLAVSGCGKETGGIGEDYYVEGKQEVTLQITYEENIFLAKENIYIYIDNHKFYTLKN